MAGLLDYLKSPEVQGLLGAAAGGMAGARRGTPWNNAGRGLLGGIGAYGNALDRQAQEQERGLLAQDREQNRAMRDLQMQQMRQQMGQQQQALDWQAGLPAVMGQMQPTYGAGEEGPTMTPGNPNAFLEYAMQPGSPLAMELLKAQYLPKNPEYKTVGGSLVEIGGGGVKEAFRAPETPTSDVRNYQHGLDNPGFTEWLRENKRAGASKVNVNTGQKDSQWGEPPKDMVWARGPDGKVVTQLDQATGAYRPMALPVSGSKVDRESSEDASKAGQRASAARTAAGNVLSAVDSADKLVGVMTSGLGSSLNRIPGTDARDLQAQLETIRANLGFDRLQQMRDMSPTGGALGQVAVQELIALQSTVASLDQAQSPAQLRASLQKIRKHYNAWLATLDGGEGAPAGAGGLSQKTVVRSGTHNGRRVVEYSDGSVDYAD